MVLKHQTRSLSETDTPVIVQCPIISVDRAAISNDEGRDHWLAGQDHEI